MNIYNNFNLNIQYKVDEKIKKNIKIYVRDKLLPEIVNYRKSFFIRSFKVDAWKSKSFKTDLYYFLNIPRANWGKYGIKQKFVDFMDKLMPYKKLTLIWKIEKCSL